MALDLLRVRGPLERDCEIVVSEADDAPAPRMATCIDTQSRAIVGACRMPREQDISPDEVMRMIGGAYRLASIAVDVETDLLGRRSRRVSDLLRLRGRLWRRWSRLPPRCPDHMADHRGVAGRTGETP